MKFYSFLKIFFFTVFLHACKPINDDYFGEPISRESFRITRQVVELLDSAIVETVMYDYELKNDYFPVKITHFADSSDSIKRALQYEFDAWRLPNKQIELTGDSVVETTQLVYSPKNYFLLEKTVYEGVDLEENLRSRYKYEYDENDFLISIYEEHFSNDSTFKNEDGNKATSIKIIKILPAPDNRFKGVHIPLSFVELFVKYWTAEDKLKLGKRSKAPESKLAVGTIFEKIETNFDSDGFPAYSARTLFDSTKSETWFKTDKDGFGQVVELISFDDFDYKVLSRQSKSLKLYYDDRTMITRIESRLYDTRTKKFDRLESLKDFYWCDHKLNNPQNFILMKLGTIEKYYDYGIGDFVVDEYRIAQFSCDQIIEEYYTGIFNKRTKKSTAKQPKKRISTFLERIKLKHFRNL